MTSKTLPDWLVPVNEHQITSHPASCDSYIRHGWRLVPIPAGTKGPTTKGWNRQENAITDPSQLPHGYGFGIAHAYSGTMALDVDHWDRACEELTKHGIDLHALYTAPDAVQINSGRPGHGKLLYRMPPGLVLPSKKLIDTDSDGLKFNYLDFRNATANGLTVQDCLPPLIHPQTRQPYRWGGNGHWCRLPEIPAPLLAFWRGLIEQEQRPASTAAGSDHADWQTIRDALEHISPDIDRDQWVRIGMALQDAGVRSGDSETAFNLWDEWSSQSAEKYKGQRDLITQWRSFKADNGQGVTLGTLFKLAKDSGWTRPPVDPNALFAGVVASREIPSSGPTSETSHKSWGELSTRIFDPIDWVVSDLIPPGVSLLVGRPKQGKSWLVHAMALMVAAGRPVFGLRTSGSPVLYLALEDSERRLHDRTKLLIRSYGLSDAELHSKFYYMTHAPMLGDGLETALQAKMDEIPGLRLIVIDVLAQVRQGRRGNQSVYEADYEVGKQLKTVSAMFPDVAILVVHHANKGGGDALDSVSGTNGLSGGVDNIFTLMHGSSGMELHINGRDIEDSSTIPLTKSPDKMWTLASRQEAAEALRSDTRATVAFAMREGASSPKEIAEAAGLPVATVDKQLSRMVRQEEVIKTGRGSYVLVEI